MAGVSGLYGVLGRANLAQTNESRSLNSLSCLLEKRGWQMETVWGEMLHCSVFKTGERNSIS